MSLSSILGLFSGAGADSAEFAKLESDVKALVASATSVMSAVVAGKGDVISTVIGVAEDVSAIKSALVELVAIAGDFKALVTDVSGGATSAPVPAPPSLTIAPVVDATPSPVSSPAPAVTSTNMMATVLSDFAKLDPFSPKPLAKAN